MEELRGRLAAAELKAVKSRLEAELERAKAERATAEAAECKERKTVPLF
jgi:hypothetical protein